MAKAKSLPFHSAGALTQQRNQTKPSCWASCGFSSQGPGTAIACQADESWVRVDQNGTDKQAAAKASGSTMAFRFIVLDYSFAKRQRARNVKSAKRMAGGLTVISPWAHSECNEEILY